MAEAVLAPRVDPTAVVHPRARLGEGTVVGPYAVVEADVVVGRACEIAAHAVLKTGTRVGERNRIGEHCVLGGPPQDRRWGGEDSYLVIGDDNVLREMVTVHRSAEPAGTTRIGNGNYLMGSVHVAHDCLVGDGVVMANFVGLAGHVEVEDRAVLGGCAQVHQHCRVGTLAMVGGLAAVRQDVLPFSLTAGHPARTRGVNRVGLLDAGFPPEELPALRRALRALLDGSIPLAERLARLEVGDERAQRLARFAARSERGFCARDRRRQR